MYNPQVTPILIKIRADSIGMTLAELNKKCGLNKNTISTSATSKYGLSASILCDIADALECSVDYLLERNASDTTEQLKLVRLYNNLDNDSKELIARLIVKLSEKA